jgi:hypothetical protein
VFIAFAFGTLLVAQLPQSTLGPPPQSTLEGERPSVAPAPVPVASRAAAPSGLSVFTTSKGVALERRVDASGNVQIDFAGGDPSKFSEPTVYERAKARLQAASALAPAPVVTPVATPMAPVTPMPSASSLGGPAYAPPAPLPTWQPLAASPGYEAFGTVGPDGVWRYEMSSVRPMGGGWGAQGQVQPAVNYAPPATTYAPPAVSYVPPAYYAAPALSPCGPYGCNVSGGPVGGFGPRGGLLGFGVLGRR